MIDNSRDQYWVVSTVEAVVTWSKYGGARILGLRFVYVHVPAVENEIFQKQFSEHD